MNKLFLSNSSFSACYFSKGVFLKDVVVSSNSFNYCGGKEEDEWAGETFRITLTNKGVLYHEYGGYSVFVTPNNEALYNALVDLVENKEKYAKLEGEEAENFSALLTIIAYNLSLPRISFMDGKFPQEIAIRTMEFIRKMYDDLMNKELQEETPKEDAAFREATEALEGLKESIDVEE